MQRFDLYTHVHKAIRALLFDALEAVGRTDFSHTAELPATLATVRRTLRLTREHAEHEDRDVHPLLHALAPELAADLEAGHDRFEGLEHEIEQCLARIEAASAAERVSLGQRVHDMLGGLAAEHLAHMRIEESRANRVLWAHRSDAELAEVQARIVGSIPPAGVAEWLELLLYYGNLGERAGLLAELRAGVPAEVLGELTAAARARLGAAAWAEALAASDKLALQSAARSGAAS